MEPKKPKDLPPLPHRPTKVMRRLEWVLVLTYLFLPGLMVFTSDQLMQVLETPEHLEETVLVAVAAFASFLIIGFLVFLYPYLLPIVIKADSTPRDSPGNIPLLLRLPFYFSLLLFLTCTAILTANLFFDLEINVNRRSILSALTFWFVLTFVCGLSFLNARYVELRLRREVRRQRYCWECGYDLHATIHAGQPQCPECGTPIPPEPTNA